jgi:WD40 repeat protein
VLVSTRRVCEWFLGWVKFIHVLSLDRTAKIWDVETGKVKQTLPGHSHAVSVLSLPNGIIITGS